MRLDTRTLLLTHLTVFLLGLAVAGLPLQQQYDSFAGSRTASARIVAVSEHGQGVIGTVTVHIEPGNGDVLMETDPFIRTNTQVSAKTAKNVAERLTDTSLADKDVTYSFSIEGSFVGGRSAGAAMTLATVAAIRNWSVRKDAVITGTIRPDGRIGKVGSVMQKASAAGKADMSLFLVPYGQQYFTYYEPVVAEQTVAPGITFRDVRYRRKTVSLQNVTQQRFGMETRAVRTVTEAGRFMLRRQ
ncbi:MAG: S16 family serine protease [Candidatus Nanohaloarchaea archaeon]|nr:S16 family serine protease [Candidatus Nanohaloarchaea archaeon]